MAVDVCSEISSLVASPRISFSHDLNQADVVPVEFHRGRSDAFLLESSIDFDFSVGRSFTQELPSADELFANGKILPVEIKKVSSRKEVHHQIEPIQVRPRPNRTTSSTNTADTANEETKKKRLKEFLSCSFDAEEDKPSSKPTFWQFRRSSSLNCDNARSKGFIRSLQFLSRSNSTGSAPNPKQSPPSKVLRKQQSQKQPSVTCTKSSLSSSNLHYHYDSSKRPSINRNCRSYSQGVRISPVLNIAPTYISKGTVSLFGSLFCNGKSKKKKK